MLDQVATKGRLSGIYKPKSLPASKQRSLAGKYSPSIQTLSLLAFTWAFLGWLNESYLYWWDSPIWLNRYTEYAIILGFGAWRITAEQNPYSKRRLMVLVSVVTVLWWLIPWALPFFEPYIGYHGTQAVFPSLHTPGTVTFFGVLLAVSLFGRRIICGWGCPCVAIRETVGFPFRHVTPRGELAWRLRHMKWFFFALYMVAIAVLLYPPNSWSVSYMGFFAMIVVLPYFASMLLSPFIGNRGYCRYLCPYGSTFGALNKVGFYKIEFDGDTCNDCGVCDNVCDMGIPVLSEGRTRGKIDVADCMGCGRCVTECSKNSLIFHDVRNYLIPAQRDRKWLRDWATGKLTRTHWHTATFAGLLSIILSGSWWAHQTIGTPFEMATTLWTTLCFTH
ncbi:MAG: 4Fe-4S binding protein [Rhodospirillaceae bacterium]|jgi:glutamate synthase (NADPH) small chain|nr:4Fe-4S binding protein [Rhodospirillaceae bacterium]MBT5309039.1 4Fe-4S binding protein [Rhodospirillaceae bacterium]MBT7357029.1 4Fe-4S binding protein [Rhodospirillaceae bacterium]